MRFLKKIGTASLLGIFLVGCGDLGLEVENPNAPNRDAVLGTPAEVENLAAAQYQQIVFGTTGSLARSHLSMLTMAFENASGLNNNGMGPRSNIPRQPIDNGRGNQFSTENYNDFQILLGVARNAADILARSKGEDFELSAGPQAVDRLNAWAHFVAGVSLGYISMAYDAVGIPRPSDGPEDIPEMEEYPAVNAYALAQLDSALAYASKPGVPALPGGWLTGPGGSSVSMERFRQVIHSFRARIRAGVARDATERAAVNWQAVIDDATSGITSDLVAEMAASQGWQYIWLHTSYHYRDANWHQMSYYIIGMADTGGGYDAWLATPRDSRTPFLIVTPDLRFPQGATRAAQVAQGQGAPTDGRYFRNRDPGLDEASIGWRASWYDHYRFRTYADNGRNGPHPLFTVAENDMLAAEGHIRLGQFEKAAELIDKTRVKNGLAPLTGAGITSLNDPVPGGASCVPRVPNPNTGFKTTTCGNIMEAMKWEKRMETAYTAYGAWYFDSRGWDDLPPGTPLHWPVPYQELDSRLLDIYNLGGVNQPGGAPSNNTYGFGTTPDL